MFIVSLFLFGQLIFACDFVHAISFCKKKIHWLKIVLITLGSFKLFIFFTKRFCAHQKHQKAPKALKAQRLNSVKEQNAISEQ